MRSTEYLALIGLVIYLSLTGRDAEMTEHIVGIELGEHLMSSTMEGLNEEPEIVNEESARLQMEDADPQEHVLDAE